MSNNKMYIRVGRKFQHVPNMVDMYWNGLHLLSKERRHDSVAMVVAQHYDHVTMCALEAMSEKMTWNDAKKICKSYFGEIGKLPTRAELLLLKNHSDLLEKMLVHAPSNWFWTNDKCTSNLAWKLYLHLDASFGYCRDDDKDEYRSVLAFVDIPITDLI